MTEGYSSPSGWIFYPSKTRLGSAKFSRLQFQISTDFAWCLCKRWWTVKELLMFYRRGGALLTPVHCDSPVLPGRLLRASEGNMDTPPNPPRLGHTLWGLEPHFPCGSSKWNKPSAPPWYAGVFTLDVLRPASQQILQLLHLDLSLPPLPSSCAYIYGPIFIYI